MADISDISDVPELEDMSDEIHKQRERMKGLNLGRENNSPMLGTVQNGTLDSGRECHSTGEETLNKEQCVPNTDKQSLTDKLKSSGEKSPANRQSSSKQNVSSATAKDSGGFGGFSKGFLFGDKPKQKVKKPTPKHNSETTRTPQKSDDNIPLIKGNQKQSDQKFSLPEVQEAMKPNEKLIQSTEWVTDDLLETIQKNETLCRQMTDPSFVKAMEEFQTNPEAAMIKYQNNQEVQQFFKAFCGLMGDHFSTFEDKQTPKSSSKVEKIETGTGEGADISVRSSTNPNQPTAEDERKMQDILSDPSMKEVLGDPQIQNLFTTLRSDPAEGQRILHTADGDLKQKIRKLVAAGLLQFQT